MRCNWCLSVGTMVCYAPVFFLCFAVICLCSASMRLYVRSARNQRRAVILPLRLYCAPPASAVILCPTIVEHLPQEANGAKNARSYRASRVVLSDLRASCAVSFRDVRAKEHRLGWYAPFAPVRAPW